MLCVCVGDVMDGGPIYQTEGYPNHQLGLYLIKLLCHQQS